MRCSGLGQPSYVLSVSYNGCFIIYLNRMLTITIYGEMFISKVKDLGNSSNMFTISISEIFVLFMYSYGRFLYIKGLRRIHIMRGREMAALSESVIVKFSSLSVFVTHHRLSSLSPLLPSDHAYHLFHIIYCHHYSYYCHQIVTFTYLNNE